MNILLVVCDLFFESIGFYYFKNINEETYSLIKNIKSSDYYSKIETRSKIIKIIEERKECIKFTYPFSTSELLINSIYGMITV